jgi:hypothetical protein
MMLQLTRKGLVLHGRLDVLQDRFATVCAGKATQARESVARGKRSLLRAEPDLAPPVVGMICNGPVMHPDRIRVLIPG